MQSIRSEGPDILFFARSPGAAFPLAYVNGYSNARVIGNDMAHALRVALATADGVTDLPELSDAVTEIVHASGFIWIKGLAQ